MKRSIRNVFLLFLLFMTALCLFACNNRSNGQGGSSQGSSAASSATQSAKVSVKGESEFDDNVESDEYNVVYNLNYEGSSPIVTKVASGATAVKPEDPERDGEYSFGDWYTDKNCTSLFDFSSKIEKNVVLFAGWVSSNVTVSFNYNYVGAPAVERVKMAKGSLVPAPAAPSRENYLFAGWFDGDKEFDFNAPVNDNVTLYAHWIMTKATVVFDYNYTGAPESVVVTVDVGGKVSAPADIPDRQKFSLSGWKTSSGEVYDFNSAVNADMTLYADWVTRTFTVTFDWTDYAEGTPKTVIVEYGKTVEEPDCDREYYLVSWLLNGVDYEFSTPVTSDITLVADWFEDFPEDSSSAGSSAQDSAQTPISDSAQTSISDSAQTPISDSAQTPISDSAQTPISDSAQTPASDSAQTPVSDSTQQPQSDSAGQGGEDSSQEPVDQDPIPAGYVRIYFYYNYEGAPNDGEYTRQDVKNKYRPTVPETPVRESAGGTEYYFEGWYSDEECTTAYNFNTRLTENAKAYAKWLKKYAFEAEYTDFDGKQGRGYSSNTEGTQLIKKDNGTAQASNGYYVSDLYYNGSQILFEVTSDRDIDDAVVIIRVSGEHYDMEFTPDVYEIAVNGIALDYDAFSLEGGEADIRSDDRRPFINITMKVRASLNEGKNQITMTAIADYDFDVGGRHSGTMKAIAPMIDCIYVCTDATLTWSPKTSNLDGK